MLRFASSPTGELSIDTMRVALINYIISRQRAEQFIVRIEEADKEEHIEGKDQETLDLLKKFAIEQDQLFYQSDNLGRHQQFALSLLKQNKAFACICTPEKIEADKAYAKTHKEAYQYSDTCLHDQTNITARIAAENLPYNIRIKKPETPITFIDKIKGEIQTKPEEIDSFVILRAEGNPTHNFACACDDMLTDISIVIRGEDHLYNTPRQIHVKHALGYTAQTAYAHLPTLLNTEDKQRGKQDNTDSIKWLLEEGFLPDAIINYLLLIGNKVPTEVFTLPDAITWFNLSSLSKSPAEFDIDILRFLNRQHLGAIKDKALSRLFGFADADIGKLLKLYLKEVDTINALEKKIKAVFGSKRSEGAWSEEMHTLSALIQEAPMLDDFDLFTHYLIDQSGFKGDKLLKPLRLLMTGAEHGPELSDIYPLIKPYITEIARCIT